MFFATRTITAKDFVEAYGCGLTRSDRANRYLVMLQAFFDDSGSDPSSQHYVLAGFVATLDTWSHFTDLWDFHLKKEPRLDYFKMSEAMGFNEQFNGWELSDRNKRVLEFAEIIGQLELVRIQVYLERRHFDDFVRDTISNKSFEDPYFICFNHLCLTLAATKELNWSPDYKIIFDEHGKIGDNAAFWWDENKKYMPAEWSERLGDRPGFENDVKFKPLQAADMYAWLVRDSFRRGDVPDSDLAKQVAKHFVRHRGIAKELSRDELMELGSKMLVARSNMVRDFGTDEFYYQQSSKRFVRKRRSQRQRQAPEPSS